MKLLKPGNGNQSSNRKKAIAYIKDNIFEVEEDWIEGRKNPIQQSRKRKRRFFIRPGYKLKEKTVFAT